MLTLSREPWDAADGRALRAELLATYRERIGTRPPPEVAADPEPADLLAWLVARDGHGAALGCGALCAPGELRRMYVRPAARGRGVGRALLVALEDEARGAGLAELTLHTTEALVEARGLYAAAGYATVREGVDGERVDQWMAKRL